MLRGICERCGAKENSPSYRITPLVLARIRTHLVCNQCFNELKRDNQELVRRGKEIPNKLLTLTEIEEAKQRTKLMNRRI